MKRYISRKLPGSLMMPNYMWVKFLSVLSIKKKIKTIFISLMSFGKAHNLMARRAGYNYNNIIILIGAASASAKKQR